MPRTRLVLDVPRYELSEAAFSYHKYCHSVTATQSGKNCVYKWPGTGSWTLQPINITPDFSETNFWEALKFRLADVNYDAAIWNEIAENVLTDPASDYFMLMRIPGSFVPGPGSKIGSNLTDFWTQPVIPTQNFTGDSTYGAMQSKEEMPVNTGYCLRFWISGRGDSLRARFLKFYFGDYVLILNTDGQAELWQTFDYISYGFVFSFQWVDDNHIHGNWHRLIIYPHARNKIEFHHSFQHGRYAGDVLASSGDKVSVMLYGGELNPGVSTYTIPGVIEFTIDVDGSPLPVITKAGHWGLASHREFRPYIQVSRIAFFTGEGPFNGLLYDLPITLDQPPTLPSYLQPDGDINGCATTYNLLDPSSATPLTEFVPDGVKRTMQFAIQFHGLSDIGLNNLGSTRTSELYGYSIDKPAGFILVPGTPVSLPVISATIDSGDSPESERLTVQIDNSQKDAFGNKFGQADRFARQPDIPLVLINIDGNGNVILQGYGQNQSIITQGASISTVLFEGTSHTVRSSEAQAQHPRTVEIEAFGMADNLLRKHWLWSAGNNFGKDPHDPTGRAWDWQSVIRRCMNNCGFADQQIAFEGVGLNSANDYNFRLWLDGGSGGSAGPRSPAGDGHNPVPGGRWWPEAYTPVYEFMDMLIRRVLGWEFNWDKSDRSWHIYKRPMPNEFASYSPKCIFLTRRDSPALDAATNFGIPIYYHRSFATETKRPECTTVIVTAQISGYESLTKQQLAELMDKVKNNPDVNDPLLVMKTRLVPLMFDNPNGYASFQHPDPDITSPDYLHRRRERLVHIGVCPNKDCLGWIGRRLYYDMCIGQVIGNWNAHWGDRNTYNLRKYDLIVADSGRDVYGHPNYSLQAWWLHRIEPQWMGGGTDKNRRARYQATLFRNDVPPPRQV